MMHKIRFKIELEDGSTLLVSPEHTVYGKLSYSLGGNQELPKTEGGMCPPAVRDGTALFVSPGHTVYGVVLDKSLINSEVENTLTKDCCFNSLSLDQIAQSKFNANATKSMSSGSGEMFFASSRKSLYSESENTLTNMSNAFRTSSYSLLDSLDILQISSLCSSNSSTQKEGVANSKISKFNINFFVSDSFLKKENNTFVSTTNFIHTKPSCFNLSNLPFFTSRPSSMHSSSVNLLFLSNSSSLSSSKSLVSLNFMNSSTPFANSDSSTLNRSGILITNSGISILSNNIYPLDINNFSLLEVVSHWNYLIGEEMFKVTADAIDPGDVSTWTSVKPWGSDKDSGVTVTYGQFKDLYLAFELKGSGTGNATISVLGEVV